MEIASIMAEKITVQQLTAELRKTVGTPFHHGGRVSGTQGGLDCGGILVVALRNLGYEVFDKPHYNRGDGLFDMMEVLKKNNFTDSSPQRTEGSGAAKLIPQPGDLILLRTTAIYHHLVYYTEDNTIIHSWVTTGVNKVVENQMLPEWWDQIHSIWRFKGLS